MIREFEVLLYGIPIGTLTEDSHGPWVLRFSDQYRRLEQRPVLGQKFEDALDRRYRGKGPGSLPPFFANLVPEGELRPILENALDIERNNDVALLTAIGRDLPGAVEVRALSNGAPERQTIEDDTVEPMVPRDEDEGLRFSLAGVQVKFSVILAADKITLPAHGSLGDWLVKLDSRRFLHLCRNEYSIMAWARQAGFAVPECRLMPSSALIGRLGEHAESDTHVLLVRRYDRVDDTKIHQEDFAQVVNLEPRRKYDHVSYEQLAKLIEAIVGSAGRDEVIRRFVFMIASGNCDAHLKNWSLIYPDRVHAQLSPLYDQVATVAWPELDRKLALNFAGGKDLAHLSRESVAHFAERVGFDTSTVLKLVDDTLERLAQAWTVVSRGPEWAIVPEHVDALRNHWERTPLLRESRFMDLVSESIHP